MLLKDRPVNFELDIGASCNIINKSLLCGSEKINSTNQVLIMYNNTKVRPLGKCNLTFINPQNNMKYKADFVIIDDPRTPILGSKAVQQMNLLKVNHENIMSIKQQPELTKDELTKQFADVFTGLGHLEGDYHL